MKLHVHVPSDYPAHNMLDTKMAVIIYKFFSVGALVDEAYMTLWASVWDLAKYDPLINW